MKYQMWFLRMKIIKYMTLLLMMLGIILLIVYSGWLSQFNFFQSQPVEDISCHYLRPDDDLPSSESESFDPSEHSIFFHETSCRAGLNPRQACAVESAARNHPRWQIHVLFSAPVSKAALKNGTLADLRKFGNIIFSRLHIIDHVEGTPLEDLVRDGALNMTRWKVSHTSDVLRYLTLYKWGGVYLDLDTVCARPFDGLAKNWAAKESKEVVAAGALAFSRDGIGRWLAENTINELKLNFRGDDWGHNGPGVITRVLKRLCNTSKVELMNAATCMGFEVYEHDLFYPVAWQEAKKYFVDSGELVYGNPFSYHFWNKVTKDMNVSSTSVYALLAEKYCPLIYFKNKDSF